MTNSENRGHDFWAAWSHANSLYSAWSVLHGVNYYRLLVLYILDTKGPITQKAICELDGLPKQTVNSVVNGLKKEGYVVLAVNQTDKREKLVVLTLQGAGYAKETLEPLYSMEQAIFEQIGKRRFQQTLETIQLFNELFDKKMEETKNV